MPIEIQELVVEGPRPERPSTATAVPDSLAPRTEIERAVAAWHAAQALRRDRLRAD